MSIRLASPCLVVLVGPAGAGKTVWAAQHFRDNEIASSDALRAVVGLGPHDQRASPDAFDALHLIVERRAARGLTSVIDTLGLDEELRAWAREVADRHDLPCYAVRFDTPADVCRARNKERDRPVPAKILKGQFERYAQVRPALDGEGFADVFSAGDAVTRVPAQFVAATAAADRQRESPLPLSFGLQLSSFEWIEDTARFGTALRDIAVAAETAGFESLWVMDHFIQIPQVGRQWDAMPESYTTLSYLAGATERIKLGTLVTGAGYRNPAHLAKIVATLDVLSGGRAMCGVGAGWFRKEMEAYGWDVLPVADRMDLLEDTLRLLPLMWGPGNKPFAGKRIEVPDTTCYPRPIQERLPILVGGQGERRTLRLAARYADMCNLRGEPELVRQKLEVLHRHCEDVGRPAGEVTVTHLSRVLVGKDTDEVSRLVTEAAAGSGTAVDPERYATAVNAGTPEDHIGRYRELAEAGVRHAIVAFEDLTLPEAVEGFRPVIAAFG